MASADVIAIQMEDETPAEEILALQEILFIFEGFLMCQAMKFATSLLCYRILR